jgi:hypothetical protein
LGGLRAVDDQWWLTLGHLTDRQQAFCKNTMAAIFFKVLAGDLQQGKQRIQLQSIKSAELQTEDKLKKLTGSAGWGFTGAIVGGLLTGGIGLAVGGLAGILSGGNKTEVCFSCELEDGRKFLAVTSKENWQKILAATFGKDQSSLTPVQLSSENLSENQDEVQAIELESPQPVDPVHEVEIDEARKYIESILSRFDVKIQANQAKEQLTIVINREASSSVNYLELSVELENEIIALKTKGIRFKGVDKIKVIGRIIGNAKPEWQKILYSDESFYLNKDSSLKPESTDKVSSDIKDKAIVILGHFWKWYISGFASRPDKAFYESPRFYRILLSISMLSFAGNFLPRNSVESSSIKINPASNFDSSSSCKKVSEGLRMTAYSYQSGDLSEKELLKILPNFTEGIHFINNQCNSVLSREEKSQVVEAVKFVLEKLK